MISMLVVPTLTRHDLLYRMLASVDVPVGHLVVIDNSGRGVVERSGPWEKMTVLRMPVNFGVAASWNLAVKMGHRHDWVMVASDDTVFPTGALAGFAGQSGEDRLVVSATWPHWCAFTIGMGVVRTVGLFDEGYYPAYYEDTEYERRMAGLNMPVEMGPEVHHDNSSTLRTPGSRFPTANVKSHKANKDLYGSGRHHGFDPYRWREQSWG
jgi:GT2 family glycosyltransferase